MDAGSISRLMTAEEFFEWLALPEKDNRFFEIVRGEVLELPFTTHIQGVVWANVGLTSAYTLARPAKAIRPATTAR